MANLFTNLALVLNSAPMVEKIAQNQKDEPVKEQERFSSRLKLWQKERSEKTPALAEDLEIKVRERDAQAKEEYLYLNQNHLKENKGSSKIKVPPLKSGIFVDEKC